MIWPFLLQKLVTLSKLSSVTHSYKKNVALFFLPTVGFFSDSFLFGSIIGLDLIPNLLCISHKLTACWFQKGASVHFSFELVAVYKPNADRCGYESLAGFFLQRMLIYLVVFMDILIPGLVVCIAELTQVMQDKTSMEFQDLLRKLPAPWRRPWQSYLVVKLPQVETCWKESRSRWLLCKCGETLSERLLNREKIRRG